MVSNVSDAPPARPSPKKEAYADIGAIPDTPSPPAAKRVESPQPMRVILDAAAVAAVREWRFTPTLLNGTPVAVVMTVTVAFNLN